MKVLIDECVPKGLALYLAGHDVKTVAQVGWTGIKNGELLRRCVGQFDVFLTVDKRLPDQQKPDQLDLGVLLLISKSNRLADLQRLVPDVLVALSQGPFKGVVRVGT